MACHRRIEQRLDTPLNAAAAIARSLAFMDTSGVRHAEDEEESGHILIPGIYDEVEPPSSEEKESWTHLPYEKEYLASEVGATQLTGEKEFSVFERTSARPTFEVHG